RVGLVIVGRTTALTMVGAGLLVTLELKSTDWALERTLCDSLGHTVLPRGENRGSHVNTERQDECYGRVKNATELERFAGRRPPLIEWLFEATGRASVPPPDTPGRSPASTPDAARPR